MKRSYFTCLLGVIVSMLISSCNDSNDRGEKVGTDAIAVETAVLEDAVSLLQGTGYTNQAFLVAGLACPLPSNLVARLRLHVANRDNDVIEAVEDMIVKNLSKQGVDISPVIRESYPTEMQKRVVSEFEQQLKMGCHAVGWDAFDSVFPHMVGFGCLSRAGLSKNRALAVVGVTFFEEGIGRHTQTTSFLTFHNTLGRWSVRKTEGISLSAKVEEFPGCIQYSLVEKGIGGTNPQTGKSE